MGQVDVLPDCDGRRVIRGSNQNANAGFVESILVSWFGYVTALMVAHRVSPNIALMIRRERRNRDDGNLADNARLRQAGPSHVREARKAILCEGGRAVQEVRRVNTAKTLQAWTLTQYRDEALRTVR